jgi:hypothetical protein
MDGKNTPNEMVVANQWCDTHKLSLINSLCIRIGDDFNIDENAELLWEAALYAGINSMYEKTLWHDVRRFQERALDYYHRVKANRRVYR